MLNAMTLNDIHRVLESYDRKYVKCNQITKVREEKHYKRKEMLDIYLKLLAKYNRLTDKERTFGSLVYENIDKLDQL